MKDLHTTPNEHLEARITAWVLGQASPFEAAELEALCAADPELQLFLNRTKALHSLLLETPPSSSDQFWKLSPEKREKLDPIIGPNSETPSNKHSSVRRAAYRTAFGIAAVITVTVFIKRFVFISPSMYKESSTIVAYSMESDELYAPAAAEELSIIEKKSNGKQRSVALSSPRKPAAPSSSAVIPVPASEQALALADRNSDEKLSGGGGGGAPGNIMFRLKVDDATEGRENKDIATSSMAKVIAAASNSPLAIPVPNVDVSEPSLDFGDGKDFGGGWGSAQGNAVTGKNDGGIGYMRFEGSGDYAIQRESVDAILNNPDRSATDGVNVLPASKSDYYRAAYDHTRAELLMQVDKAWELAVPAEGAQNEDPFDTTTKHIEIAQGNNKELGFGWFLADESKKAELSDDSEDSLLENIPVTPAFSSAIGQVTLDKVPLLGEIPAVGRLFKPSLVDLSEEISAKKEVFSTFSLNISDASFQLALAAIEKGERPDPASIKPEQFYNAVDYGDPAPSASEPVAAAIDQTAHPVIPGRNLVRVALRTASTGRSAAQPLRLTLLVDQSGSMVRADRRVAMETALASLATLLTENDQVTVIGFSRTPHLLAQSLPGNQAAKLPDLINQTASEGGTNLEQAINLATEQALSHHLAGAQNRIVLFTDGAANLGDADPDRLSKKIQDLRQQGLAFDIAGIGTNDLNDRLLSDLARHGNGRYYLVGEKTGANLAAQLAGAFRPAAENVKVQVKLNPQRVGNYKLIGFEKDRLKTEDFRNDAVDAAELAADEAGVALYQVETLPEGSGEIGEVSVRFRDTASGEMVERTWTIPYDASAPSFDKANPKTQLATLALLAAQKLQPGPMADAIDFSNYSETIAKLRQANAKSAKTQQLFNLINALK